VKAADLIVMVRCLHCRHRSTLGPQALVAFGVKPDAPIAAFVKRLRCTKCGSGSVMATRVARTKRPAAVCALSLAADLRSRRLPPPWSVEERPACFIVNGRSLRKMSSNSPLA
jgi:hypothetical protein